MAKNDATIKREVQEFPRSFFINERSRLRGELRDLHSEIGYMIVDDVLSLPEECREFIEGWRPKDPISLDPNSTTAKKIGSAVTH